jgi:4-hydroxyphenylpyruvate dioxygenase
MSALKDVVSAAPKSDPLELRGYDYVEFYVGNAHQAAHYFRTAFGFTPTAYSGLETKNRERVSYVVEQGNIRLVLTSALNPADAAAEHVKLHGDGVKDIAFAVRDAGRAFAELIARGARPVMEPTVIEDELGRVVKATVGVYGDTVHSLIQRNGYEGAFLPGYVPVERKQPPAAIGLSAIDHIAVSMEPGQLERWVDFYKSMLNFHESHREDVETAYSAMNSKVVQNSTGRIKFPMVEPASGRRRSQIEEYLEFYHGPGVQHVAFLSGDIVKSVGGLRAGGSEFLRTPDTYYEMLKDRVGSIREDVNALRGLNILVDRDEWGYLMQIFTKPVQSRPTVFMEVIQRRGARGFGSGNIRALFEALEREQTLRGNL